MLSKWNFWILPEPFPIKTVRYSALEVRNTVFLSQEGEMFPLQFHKHIEIVVRQGIEWLDKIGIPIEVKRVSSELNSDCFVFADNMEVLADVIAVKQVEFLYQTS